MTKRLLAACAAMITLIVMIFVSCEFVFADQIIPGVSIAERSYTGENPSEIKQNLIIRLDQSLKDGLILKNNESKYKLDLVAAGVSFDYDQAVTDAIAYSHGNYFGVGAWHTFKAVFWKSQNITVPVTIDQAKLSAITKSEIYKQFSKSPVDATLNIANTTVEILPSIDGLWVDDEKLAAQIITAVSSGETQIIVPMFVKVADIQPEQLGQAKLDAEKILSQKISLTSGTKVIIPDPADVKGWIIVKTDGSQIRAGVDLEKIKSYLTSKVTPLIEQRTVAQINSTDGSEIQSGRNGITLNVVNSASLIAEAINRSAENPTIKLATEIKSMSTSTFDPQAGGTPSLAEGKYIEVSLSRQRMYLFEGANFVNSFGVSTGKWSTPTPTGTFSIYNKIEVAHSAAYDLYMPKWNAITADGQYGIHGLPYKGNWVEGASHIGTPVSHGCIRLGPGNDSYVYGWAPVGTPVFIHK